MIATAIVSPSARPRPSIEPLITPDLPNGSTAIRIISQRVAPSASAPSSRRRGVCAKTSRATAEMIGRIITASTTPTTSMVRPVTDAGPSKSGIQPRCSSSHSITADRRRAEDEDPPEPVDDARDRGQQIDDVAERLRQPPRRDVGDEQRDGDGQRDRDHDREPAASTVPKASGAM